MNVLLDNNMPVGFSRLIPGHDVVHARDIGWQQLRNGDLLNAANERFEALITLDKNMEHQTSHPLRKTKGAFTAPFEPAIPESDWDSQT